MRLMTWICEAFCCLTAIENLCYNSVQYVQSIEDTMTTKIISTKQDVEWPLNPLPARILEIIQSSPDWMTRQDIADALNRRQLSPYDKTQLERLLIKGLIEIRQATRGAVGKRFEYRAKG